MPYSLRTKLKHLACERDITVKECERLIKALDTVDAVEEIKAEIQKARNSVNAGNEEFFIGVLWWGIDTISEIIDKHMSGKEQE